jgi:hypothetical protein
VGEGSVDAVNYRLAMTYYECLVELPDDFAAPEES